MYKDDNIIPIGKQAKVVKAQINDNNEDKVLCLAEGSFKNADMYKE